MSYVCILLKRYSRGNYQSLDMVGIHCGKSMLPDTLIDAFEVDNAPDDALCDKLVSKCSQRSPRLVQIDQATVNEHELN